MGNKITIIDCLQEKNISKLVREHGQSPIDASLIMLVTKKMELFNAKYRLSDAQVVFFVDSYIDDFKFETMSDLGLCLNNAAKGKYGTIYNAIDPPTIFGWFKTHLDEKANEREQKKSREKFGTDWDSKVIETVKGAISATKNSKTLDSIKKDTSSKWWAKIMQQIDVMDEKYLHDLRKRMKNASGRGNYDDKIKDIDNELKRRK